MAYDPNNIFAKILRGEIPCSKVYEDKFALAFHDIKPKAKIHVLVIPKSPYATAYDFHAGASEAEITGFYRAVNTVLEQLDLVKSAGYRLLSNTGPHAGQEVLHYHIHIFSGQPLGPMLSAPRQK
jgi:histidine triad (HIT) family protein